MLRVLCDAIVRKVQQRIVFPFKEKRLVEQCNRDSQKDTAPGIHFVKEKATASTISSAKSPNKKRLSMEMLLPQMIGQFSLKFQNSRHSQ